MNKALIRKIEEVTGLYYCDRNCPCGENNHLFWQNSGGSGCSSWLPDWTNGTEVEEVYKWLMKQSEINQEIRAAMIAAHMRVKGASNAT